MSKEIVATGKVTFGCRTWNNRTYTVWVRVPVGSRLHAEMMARGLRWAYPEDAASGTILASLIGTFDRKGLGVRQWQVKKGGAFYIEVSAKALGRRALDRILNAKSTKTTALLYKSGVVQVRNP